MLQVIKNRAHFIELTQQFTATHPIVPSELVQVAANEPESPLSLQVESGESGGAIVKAGIIIGPKYERGFLRSLVDPFVVYRRAKDSSGGQGKVLPYWRERPLGTILKMLVYGGVVALAASGGGDGGNSNDTEEPAPVTAPQASNDDAEEPASNDTGGSDGGDSEGGVVEPPSSNNGGSGHDSDL